MVNWRDPAIVAAENVVLLKFVHVIGGIYIWEFVSYLDFEYSVITKKRKFTWSFLLYLGCRWFPLFSLMAQFLEYDASHKIDCQALVILSFMFGYLSFMFASALVILRVAVLWNRKKIVVAFACAVWLGNTTIYAYSIATLRSAWIGSSCTVLYTAHGRISVLSTLITDLVLLVLMMIGLIRWKNGPKSYGFGRLLRVQGLIWVAIVTFAEVPPTVFILLDLNDPLNLIFQILALIITALGAARIHRGLADFNNLAKVVGDPEMG